MEKDTDRVRANLCEPVIKGIEIDGGSFRIHDACNSRANFRSATKEIKAYNNN